MDLIPYFGEARLRASGITIQIRTSDRQYAQELVRRCNHIKAVTDEASYTEARRAAAELKNLSKEIYQAKRAAKQPFEAVEASIEDLAKEVGSPVDAEYERIIALMTGYVRILEDKQKAELARQREKAEAEARAHEEKMRLLQAEKDAAEAKARAAQDELARREAIIEATKRNQVLTDAETLRNLELELRAMTLEPVRGVVPGGRVTHPYKFRLISAAETVKAGGIRLLRIELDILACQDSVRSQLEIAPDKVPTLPGIEITQETSISIKASSRIS